METAATIRLCAGGGTVFLLPLTEIPETELLARAALAPDEAERYAGFPSAARQRRKEWLAARVLAREELGGRIGYEPSGRPVLRESPGTSISISHTAGWAALMVSREGRCGVDIEPADRRAERAVRRVAVPEEIALACGLFPENPELAVWCAKEAAYKALGRTGIDFREEIRIDRIAAQTLQLTVKVDRMSLELFFWENLIGMCGSFKEK